MWTATQLKIGSEIKIGFGDAEEKSEEPREEPAFAGEITALESEPGMDGRMFLRVRSYDRSHRLHRGRETRVFKQVKDSQLAQQIAREAGLTADVQTTPGVHEWVLQDNQTNWEFLQERAARNGFEVQVKDKKLIFKPPTNVGSAVEVAWMEDMLSFRGTITTGEQVNSVEVRGWDPINKQVVVGTASSSQNFPQIGQTPTAGALAQSAFHERTKMVVSRQPIYDQQQATRLAQAVLDELAGVYVNATGVVRGDVKLQLGGQVKVAKVGSRFSGTYRVTQISHDYGPEGYNVYFDITARRSTDLVSLLAPPQQSQVRLMTGIVDAVNDDVGIGRVKVKLPMLGDDIVSDWCRVLSPGGGKNRGWQFLPEVDDEVLVIGTSMDNLYVLGGLHSSEDLPPLSSNEAAPSQEVQKRIIKTRTGHQILFEDQSNSSGSISIIDASGNNKIVLKTDDNSLTAEVNGDMSFKAVGAIKFEAGTDFSVNAQANITEQATGNVSIEGNGQATFKGTSSVRMESGANASVSAPTVSLG